MRSLKVKKTATKGEALKKIRIGVCVGKDFDPVKKNTQPANFPKKLCLTKDDWGKYSVDAVTALKMQQLQTDLVDIDIISIPEVTQKRLQKNHVNLTFWPEIGTAILGGKKKQVQEYTKVFKNPNCRLDMGGDYDTYDWVLQKSRYMQHCQKAGIPMIPTVYFLNGFDADKCMKEVQKKGWDKFFCKVGHFSFFGNGAINGKTEDFLPGGKKVKEMAKYGKENKHNKTFLVQPYMLKPNGQVFDEVRNFFIDGEWRYSVFTHGTDMSDKGYYEEPAGPRKVACRALAERVYAEVLKVSTWQGKRQTPLLNRIDIGVIPQKGADSLHKTDNQYFVNEIEMICTTWLDRYAPIAVPDVMATAAMKHSLELLVGLLNSKRKVPDEANVRKVVKILNERLGPYQHIKLKK